MKKIDVFRLPKQLYFLRIEDWQVAFCSGDKCAAAILDFFSNRHRFYLEKLEEVEQRNKALNQNETVDPFMVQTISKISDYTLSMFVPPELPPPRPVQPEPLQAPPTPPSRLRWGR